ncbi:chorion transcription factor Cf2 isoform X2 [Musca domestica]|uniref:Chorion transcription factor Cf2 isoform X2 n=1 Tax=Musca domestica TaxID=7370 RepID=A0A1I8MFC0_MUSDO|nr:chorion transcription factor Cf2 isoform X2 [Musca domestica]
MLKSPSNAQEIRLPRPEQHNSRAQSPATMDALKTSFLPNLSMDPALVSNTHFCPMCGQQFENPQQTTEHMHLCHGGLSVVAGVGGGSILLAPHHVSMADSMKIDYPCHSCDEKFGTEQDLDDHHRLVHQAPAFLARCPACSFYGISPAALQGANEYKCIHCGSVCTASALAASQPGYGPQTPEHMPTMAPHDMNLSNHELFQRQYQEQVSILQQHQEQQEQQHLQQQQEELEQQQQHQEQQQQQQQLHQEQQQQQQHHQSHHHHQPDDSPHESVQLKVPPLTVKLNKGLNGTATVIHPHVIIKEEPLNGDGMEGSPTSVPVYTIQQNPGAATSVVVSSSHDHSAVLSNQASALTTTVIVGGVPKVRHKCPDCPKTFKTPGTLAMHRKVHTGEADLTPKERPYTCSYCGKSFTQSNTLKQHTRIHTGEKPFQCTYCEKSFSVKDYLTKHIRTHTGEKPYTCPYCEKRFTQRSALTVHTTKLHPLYERPNGVGSGGIGGGGGVERRGAAGGGGVGNSDMGSNSAGGGIGTSVGNLVAGGGGGGGAGIVTSAGGGDSSSCGGDAEADDGTNDGHILINRNPIRQVL